MALAVGIVVDMELLIYMLINCVLFVLYQSVVPTFRKYLSKKKEKVAYL